jgi:phage replication O-like protein O
MQNNTTNCNQAAILPDLSEPVIATLNDGYLRIANQLMSALCLISLSDRESRILNAVILKTYGFNKSFDWISGKQLEDITGIDVSNSSKVKKRLLDRNILIKQGRKVGINPVVSDWILSINKAEVSIQTNQEVSSGRLNKKSVQINILSKQTKKVVSVDNHKKQDNKTKNTNTKDKASSLLFKGISFEYLSDEISIEAAKSFIDHRKLLKVPLTQRAFDLAMSEASKAPTVGLTSEQAIDETIAAGWKGINIAWLSSRLQDNPTQIRTSKKIASTLDYADIHDTSWADNLGL